MKQLLDENEWTINIFSKTVWKRSTGGGGGGKHDLGWIKVDTHDADVI